MIAGAGRLAAEIAAAVRLALPAHAVLTYLNGGEPHTLTGSAFIIGVAESDTALLYRLNRLAVAYAIPFLPIRLTETEIRFGPTVFPGQTACLLCTELRLTAGLPTSQPSPDTGQEDVGAHSSAPTPGASIREVPALVAIEILQTLLGEPSRARGRLGVCEKATGDWTWHPVLRHPRCPVCDSLAWSSISPPFPVGKGAGGLGRFVDDRTGIVHAVLPLPCPPGEPEPPHVALALLTNTQFHDDWATRPANEKMTTGKGRAAESARDAAIGEALERYCAMLPLPPGKLRVASCAVLDVPTIGPEAFGLYHPTQYADGLVQYSPVTADTPLHWVEGHSLTDDRPVFVPASLVYLLPLDPICQQTSSGLAAGGTFAEAALRALCEVIERDAFLFTWLTMRPAQLLDLNDAGELVADIGQHYATHGVTLTAHNLTTTGVPAILARARDERGSVPIDLIGLGCDPDPQQAMERAVLEVVQGRRARWDELARAGAPETIRTHSDHALWYALADRREAFAFLGSAPAPLPTRIGQMNDDPATLLTAVVTALAGTGHEAVIVDITTPDVRAAGMIVVRALITSLLSIHFGIGQERLGSTRLAPHSISALNRTPHPLA